MSQQIHETVANSRLPSDPAFAGQDQVGRIQSLEPAAVIASVDVIQGEAQRTQLQSAPQGPSPMQPPVPEEAALEGGRRSRLRRWLFFGMVMFTLAVGFTAGNLFPRNLLSGIWASGVRLSEMHETEAFFKLAGLDAIAIEYSGGAVDFWIEIESRGKKEIIGRSQLAGFNSGAEVRDQNVKGHFLWVRDKTGETGTETWTLATGRKQAANRSGSDVIANVMDLFKPSFPTSAYNGNSDRLRKSVKLWKGEGPGEPDYSSSSWIPFSFSPRIPTSVSPGQEVCISTVVETWKKQTISSQLRGAEEELGVTMLGLLALPQSGGNFVAAAFASELLDGEGAAAEKETVTIRLMCKEAPDTELGP